MLSVVITAQDLFAANNLFLLKLGGGQDFDVRIIGEEIYDSFSFADN